MSFPPNSITAESGDGEAVVSVYSLRSYKLQVNLIGNTGSGTITLSAKPIGSDYFHTVGSTFPLGTPVSTVVEGVFSEIKAVSGDTEDEFTLQVLAIPI